MKVNLKPSTLFYPLPVLIIGTYDEKVVPDAVNAAYAVYVQHGRVQHQP